MSPFLYSEIGRKTRDLLTKDYYFDRRFVFVVPGSSGMVLTAVGITTSKLFSGDLCTRYKSGNTTVDVKFGTSSNISMRVTVGEVFPGINTTLSFNIPDEKSGKLPLLNVGVEGRYCTSFGWVCSRLVMPSPSCQLLYPLPSLDQLLAFQVDVHYRNDHATITSKIGLTPNPVLDINVAIGTEDISLGGEAAFDTASASFKKYNVGICFNKPDFSTALILMDKGKALGASYFHNVNFSTAVGAEMLHRFSKCKTQFTIGSSHRIDSITSLKTRFCDNGKVGMTYQREWRRKSLVTFSAEYNTMAAKSASKFGIAIVLKP